MGAKTSYCSCSMKTQALPSIAVAILNHYPCLNRARGIKANYHQLGFMGKPLTIYPKYRRKATVKQNEKM